MLALRLDKSHRLVLEDVASKEPIAQIFISNRSPMQYIDLVVDAPKDKVILYQKEIERKVEKIGD